MAQTYKLALIVGLVTCVAGCQRSLQPTTGNGVPLSDISVQSAAAPNVNELDLSPAAEINAQEQQEVEKLRQWNWIAEKKVQLEGQRARKSRLAELLAMSTLDKEQFIRKVEMEGMRPGRSLSLQLQMFDCVQNRIASELEQADTLVSRLESSLQRMMEVNLNPEIEAVAMNQNRPVSEFGLSNSQLKSLEDLRIRTARDFVLQFYLPEQHELLASLLKMEVSEAKALVDQMSNEIPVTELHSLAQQTREPKSFGALPPHEEQ